MLFWRWSSVWLTNICRDDWWNRSNSLAAHVQERVVTDLRGRRLSSGSGGMLLLPSGSRLIYPASSGGESSSCSFHICLQVDRRTTSVCLTAEEREAVRMERKRRRGGRGKTERALTSRTLDGLRLSVHFLWLLLISFFSFPLSSAHSPPLLDPPLIFHGGTFPPQKTQWLCLLPSCGPKIHNHSFTTPDQLLPDWSRHLN